MPSAPKQPDTRTRSEREGVGFEIMLFAGEVITVAFLCVWLLSHAKYECLNSSLFVWFLWSLTALVSLIRIFFWDRISPPLIAANCSISIAETIAKREIHSSHEQLAVRKQRFIQALTEPEEEWPEYVRLEDEGVDYCYGPVCDKTSSLTEDEREGTWDEFIEMLIEEAEEEEERSKKKDREGL